MENNKYRLITEEEKSILRGVKAVKKELNETLEEYLQLILDIDDGLDTLYEHEAMTNAEIMEFIERNECLYAYNEAKNFIEAFKLPFEMYAIIPLEFLLKARILVFKKLDYYGLEVE